MRRSLLLEVEHRPFQSAAARIGGLPIRRLNAALLAASPAMSCRLIRRYFRGSNEADLAQKSPVGRVHAGAIAGSCGSRHVARRLYLSVLQNCASDRDRPYATLESRRTNGSLQPRCHLSAVQPLGGWDDPRRMGYRKRSPSGLYRSSVETGSAETFL